MCGDHSVRIITMTTFSSLRHGGDVRYFWDIVLFLHMYVLVQPRETYSAGSRSKKYIPVPLKTRLL